jgi:Mrp family chromosome partitioning ATPase
MPQSNGADDLETLHPIQGLAGYPVDGAGNAEAQQQDHGRLQDQQEQAHASASEPHPPLSGVQGASALETAAEDMIGAVSGQLMGRVAVIGARPGVDTTPIAVLLARTFAGKGKVMLLDLAPGGPGLSALGADTSMPGINELVAGSASLPQASIRLMWRRWCSRHGSSSRWKHWRAATTTS